MKREELMSDFFYFALFTGMQRASSGGEGQPKEHLTLRHLLLALSCWQKAACVHVLVSNAAADFNRP
jgi:hypothetical protein